MTSDAKYEVSQFWILRGPHRLNSGGELAFGASAEGESKVTEWLLGLQETLPWLRVQRDDSSARAGSRAPHTGSTACPGGFSAGGSRYSHSFWIHPQSLGWSRTWVPSAEKIRKATLDKNSETTKERLAQCPQSQIELFQTEGREQAGSLREERRH